MPSTRTEPIACRVEPIYVDALGMRAELYGETLSMTLANMIRATTLQPPTRESNVSTGA